MKRLSIAVAVALVAGGCVSKPKLAKEPVLMPVAADPTVAYSIAFAVGSQHDPRGKEGLAHLTATLMAEGATRKHAYQEILKLLYPMASSYDVRVDKEQTTFTGRTHRDNVEAYTELLLDAIAAPAFTEADFQRVKERTVAQLEKALRYSSDEELGKAALHGAVFAGTPYAHLPLGTVAGLEAISLDDVRQFYRTHFTRRAALVGLGGDYEPGLLDRVRDAIARLPDTAPPVVPAPAVRAAEGREVVIVEKPGPATAISFGFPIDLVRGPREFYALWLANSWLGEHRNSSAHLYQVIREARGLNYGDYSYVEYFPEGGARQMPPPNVPRRRQLFEVWIRPVPNETAHFALRAAMRELERLVEEGLSEDEFRLQQQFLQKYALHFADTTALRLGYAVDDRFHGIDAPGHLARFREVVPTLTREEVNAAIRKHLRPRDAVIAIVTEQAQVLADALAAEAPSPIAYATPKPAEVIAEDAAISAHPLAIDRARIRIVPVDDMFAR